MTGLPLRFPILAFVPDYEPSLVVGREQIEVHFNEDWFTTVSEWHLKNQTRIGVEFVDFNGRTWRINAVSDLGSIGENFWQRMFGNMRRVQYDLSELPALPMDAIKERLCESIRTNSIVGWRRQPAFGAPGWPPRDNRTVLQDFLEKIRGASSLLELIAVLYFQPFE